MFVYDIINFPSLARIYIYRERETRRVLGKGNERRNTKKKKRPSKTGFFLFALRRASNSRWVVKKNQKQSKIHLGSRDRRPRSSSSRAPAPDDDGMPIRCIIKYLYNSIRILLMCIIMCIYNIIYADGAVFFLQGHIVITTHARDLHPFVLLLLLLLLLLCARVPVDFVDVWHNTISGGCVPLLEMKIFL